jgi:anti-sigma factor RsiW
MRFSDETLMAFADGELDEQTRRDVEQAMRGDPTLAAKVRQHLALRAHVFGIFEPQHGAGGTSRDAEPALPDNVVHLNTVRPLRCPPPQSLQRRWSWPEWSALLFALAIGFLGGALALLAWQGPRQIAALDAQGSALSAHGTLATALSQQLASEPGEQGISIGASFVSKEENYCRSFMLPGVAGLACRRADHWIIPVLAERVGNAIPEPVRAAMSARMAGQAFDANAEREAQRQLWKR